MAKNTMPVSHAKTAYGLLGEIARLIVEEPKRYNQHGWLQREQDRSQMQPVEYPSCGTVGCVAGWVVALKAKRRPNYFRTGDKAADILGLDVDQHDELFGSSAAGETDRQTPEHAEAGASHIRRFMQANRAQLLAKKV